jgi:hypothetical protein
MPFRRLRPCVLVLASILTHLSPPRASPARSLFSLCLSFPPPLSSACEWGAHVQDGKMDGCAILFKKSRFVLVEKHALEFNHVAMSRARSPTRPPHHL